MKQLEGTHVEVEVEVRLEVDVEVEVEYSEIVEWLLFLIIILFSDRPMYELLNTVTFHFYVLL